MKIDVIGFYKFKKINSPEKYQNLIKKKLSNNSVKGTVLLTPEGVNGTIAGKKNEVSNCISYIKKKFYIQKFDSENFSEINYQPFNSPKIKIKQEVVPIGLKLSPLEKKKK